MNIRHFVILDLQFTVRTKSTRVAMPETDLTFPDTM